MEYKILKAEEYCDSVRDGTHDSPKKVEKGFKLITSKHIRENSIDFESAYCISEEDYIKVNQRSLVEKNDILYSMIGTIGLIYRVNEKPSFAIKNMGLFKMNDELKSKWLFYYLKSPDMISYIKTLLTGSTQQYVTLKNLRELPIKFPKQKEDMQKIIKILENIDKKIELNNLINDNLLKIIDSVYKKEFAELEKFDKAENIANITIGKTPPRSISECFSQNDKDIKWVSISDLGKCGTYVNNTSERLTRDAVDKYNVKIIPKETVILSFKLTVGRVAITRDEMATNEAIAHFNLKNEAMKYFIYCYLKNFDFGKLGSTSSIATAVNSKIIKAMPIAIPNSEKLIKFNNIVKSLFERVKNNEIENETLSDLRDTLLPKLMNGQIDLDKIK